MILVEKVQMRLKGDPPGGLASLTAFLLDQRTYRRILLAVTTSYAIIYSFLSGTLVFQPSIRFSETYLVDIPSAVVIPIYGAPGQIPRLVIYLTENLGFLLVPLNLVLLIGISLLVGWNAVFGIYAYRHLPRGDGRRSTGVGVGAMVGLFTGCPTCAGLLLASMLGSGAASAATALASLQTLLIGLAIPILFVTPILLSRKIVGPVLDSCRLAVREKPGNKH